MAQTHSIAQKFILTRQQTFHEPNGLITSIRRNEMKADFVWKNFPEPSPKLETSSVHAIQEAYVDLGMNQIEVLKCGVEGSVVDTFLQSDVVTNYVDMCTKLATFLPF